MKLPQSTGFSCQKIEKDNLSLMDFVTQSKNQSKINRQKSIENQSINQLKLNEKKISTLVADIIN
jgi:hypothetical protein